MLSRTSLLFTSNLIGLLLSACGSRDGSESFTSVTTDVSAEESCYGEPDAFTCACEMGIARKANEMRRAVGKPALTYDRKISYVSRLWSREQARLRRSSHDWSFNGTWSRKYEETWNERSPMASENVAYNWGFASAAECATKFSQQWRNSPGHYENIIDRDGLRLRTLGVGVAKASDGTWYATQNFGR